LIETFLRSPHRRWNALKRDWVVVSPQRTERPWQGQMESPATPELLQYDPACYLCPGNTRAGGEQTPRYRSTYVFANDYAALNMDVSRAALDVGSAGLLRTETERGVCRVLCFDPRHDVTLATMELPAVRSVVNVWRTQAADLGGREDIRYVQIFENRGTMMGASNPHPHGQIWATEHIPNEPIAEFNAQQEFFSQHGVPLLQRYLGIELAEGERVVATNATWVALVPFWAVWPFELLLLPRRSVPSLAEMNESERDGLAAILKLVTATYNRLFDTPFPYSMGFHPAPCDNDEHPEWTLHAHFYPPLLRSATVRKFMVGFELLGSPQRDITPEVAAEALRRLVNS
jgi:UDPglucose--hexose-1-phosphate uridylyltransferase